MLKYRKVIFSHHLNLLEIALPFISEDSLSFVLFVGLNKGRKDYFQIEGLGVLMLSRC